MIFEKKIFTKKEVNKFKEDYSSNQIKKEGINNFLSAFSKSIKVKEMNLFVNQPQNIRMLYLIDDIFEDAMKMHFGKQDFMAEGRKKYRVWVLNFLNETFIVQNKREVLIQSELNDEVIDKAIEFERAFINFCLDYAFNNIEMIKPIHRSFLMQMKSQNMVNNNHVSFEFRRP